MESPLGLVVVLELILGHLLSLGFVMVNQPHSFRTTSVIIAHLTFDIWGKDLHNNRNGSYQYLKKLMFTTMLLCKFFISVFHQILIVHANITEISLPNVCFWPQIKQPRLLHLQCPSQPPTKFEKSSNLVPDYKNGKSNELVFK